MSDRLRIGTRGSRLARCQAQEVVGLLERSGFSCELVMVKTAGDKHLHVPIHRVGVQGVFVKALEEALLDDRIDIAVHSAKDMPARLDTPFECIAYGARKASNDVLLSSQEGLERRIEAGKSCTLGTSSLRRQAQLRAHYPHLSFVDLRGNIDTRLHRLQEGACDGLVLAKAAVDRLDIGRDFFIHVLDVKVFVPAVGQGCWAIEACKGLDAAWKRQIQGACNHEATAICVRAERSFLAMIAGGCTVPAFGLAVLERDEVCLEGGIFDTVHGHCFWERARGAARDAEKIGLGLGKKIVELCARRR